MKREVHETERSLLKDKLDLLEFSLSEAVSVVCVDILHGLTDDVIKRYCKEV